MITIDKQNNDKIDRCLQTKQDSMYAYAQAMRELDQMGVKIGRQESGDISLPLSYNDYLEKYGRSNLEFEWTATYNDGSTLQQFGPGLEEEHHFGEIDQGRLVKIEFISNFNWPTDNEEKRVVVGLDIATGIFSFMNGQISQEDKGILSIGEVAGPKKLLLLIRKRETPVIGGLTPELQQYYGPIDEVFYYNRFILGFESDIKKRVVMIQPNGHMHYINHPLSGNCRKCP